MAESTFLNYYHSVKFASQVGGQAFRAVWAEARGQELICIYHDVQDVADVSSHYNALLRIVAKTSFVYCHCTVTAKLSSRLA